MLDIKMEELVFNLLVMAMAKIVTKESKRTVTRY